jgi:LytS/YehU family sensor histidine kinase
MGMLTLVENAVRHGIDPSENGGTIEVGAAQDERGWHAWVEDSGVGWSPRAVPGTGLDNLRQRLQAFYGGRARLEITPVQPHGLRAQITIAAPA